MPEILGAIWKRLPYAAQMNRPVILLVSWFCLTGSLHAQAVPSVTGENHGRTELPRFELGFEAADLRTGCIGRKNCYLPSAAVGIGASMNLSPHLALTADWLETVSGTRYTTNEAGGHASELLAGVRSELRARRYGFFVDGAAGFFRWSEVIQSATIAPPATLSFTYGARTDAALRFGAGVEYSPARRVHVRGQLEDLLLLRGGGLQNFEPSVGLFYGFGTPIQWTPPAYAPPQTHRFLDRRDFAVLGIGQLGTTADTITTYQATRRGLTEGDPVVRPLVKYGIPGQISLQVLEAGLEVAGMYGFHRLHQHWAERVVPLAVGTGHGVLAFRNTRQYSRSQPTR